MNMDLHARLIARQPTVELERKKDKAMRKGYWTVESIDYATRAGEELSIKLQRYARKEPFILEIKP